jgi:hypothetical protein
MNLEAHKQSIQLTASLRSAIIHTVEHNSGRLAQLGERRVRNAEAGGSIPPPSTKPYFNLLQNKDLTDKA